METQKTVAPLAIAKWAFAGGLSAVMVLGMRNKPLLSHPQHYAMGIVGSTLFGYFIESVLVKKRYKQAIKIEKLRELELQ